MRQTARQFVEEEVIPTIRDCYREARFPADLMPKMGSLGLLRRQPGRLRLRRHEQRRVRPDHAGTGARRFRLRSFASVQGALVMYPILTFGSEEQKQRWLPRLQSGEAVGCFGLTEPDFGSNPAGMRTTARRDGDGWVLNGEKTWITNGTIADVAVVWARTRGGHPRLPGGEGNAGLSRPPTSTASGPCAPRSPPACRSPTAACRAENAAARRQGPEGRAHVPDAGALRHRLGRARRGHGLLRDRAPATRSCASSSTTGPSPRTSSCRRSWPG